MLCYTILCYTMTRRGAAGSAGGPGAGRPPGGRGAFYQKWFRIRHSDQEKAPGDISRSGAAVCGVGPPRGPRARAGAAPVGVRVGTLTRALSLQPFPSNPLPPTLSLQLSPSSSLPQTLSLQLSPSNPLRGGVLRRRPLQPVVVGPLAGALRGGRDACGSRRRPSFITTGSLAEWERGDKLKSPIKITN